MVLCGTWSETSVAPSQLTQFLANSKTERFLIHCARHFSSRLPPSGGTCKYAKAPSTKKNFRDSLPIDMLLSAVSVLVVAQSSSEVPEALMSNHVFTQQFGAAVVRFEFRPAYCRPDSCS